MRNLAILVEIEEDKKDLIRLGLTPEEVDGYVEMYIETYFEEELERIQPTSSLNLEKQW